MAGPKAPFLRMPSFLDLDRVYSLDDGSSMPVMRGMRVLERLARERLETSARRGRSVSPESGYDFNDDTDGSSTLVGSADDDSDAMSGTDFASSSSSATSIQVLAAQQKAASRDAGPKLIAGHIRGAKISKPLGHEHRKGLTVGHQIHTVNCQCLAPPDVDDEQVTECREGDAEAALSALEGLPHLGEVQAAPLKTDGDHCSPSSPAPAPSSSAWSNVAVADYDSCQGTVRRLEGFPYDMRSLVTSESSTGCYGGRLRSALRRMRSAFRCRGEVEEMC